MTTGDMSVDMDENLLHAFRTMGTDDREALVREFQRVLGKETPISDRAAEFFLDMNDWNLQAALCSYYDYGSPADVAIPSMSFVRDITIGEGESVSPNSRFTKTWRIKNSGSDEWPVGCALLMIEGDRLTETDRIWVGNLAVGQETDVSVEMQSPLENGVYQSRWCMITPNGIPFGETIWCIIVVESHGLLALTQRLAAGHIDRSTPPLSIHRENPFASSFSPPGGPSPLANASMIAHRGSVTPPALQYDASTSETPPRPDEMQN